MCWFLISLCLAMTALQITGFVFDGRPQWFNVAELVLFVALGAFAGASLSRAYRLRRKEPAANREAS
jgi:uncharacterized membrane protein YfcA